MRVARVVAVVDDDVSYRESLVGLLRSMSFAAQGFTSGWEFLSSKSLPAVVCAVLDVKMPDMSGLELQKRLAERRPGLPTIFVTAQADEASRASALEAGALAFLGKPVAEGELLGHVRRAATVWS